MSTRATAPVGAPCWTDLWTPDLDAVRRFYPELFGWDAGEAAEEFGGYFMFFREGAPVAGCMGPIPGVPGAGEGGGPDNRWRVYLSTDDITKTVAATTAEGGHVLVPEAPVADLGVQAVLIDPSGAKVGAWQPGAFPGFTVLGEPGTPSWFELHTGDYDRAVAYYRAVFRWDTRVVGDSDDFRYTVMADPGGDGELAGVFDAGAHLGPGDGGEWKIYWEVDDVDDAVARVATLGGAVVEPAADTPYGRVAEITDPAGAPFRLRGPRQA